MKMTNGIMKVLFDAINKPGFMNGATGQTGYALYRNARILSIELKDYDKVINDAINKYGKKTENGYVIDQSDKKSLEKFTKAVIPVANLEIDVDLYQIPADVFELPYCENATPSDYAIIEEFFVLPEKQENSDELIVEG